MVGWQHGYLGVIMMVAGYYIQLKWKLCGRILFAIGAVLAVDEVYQIVSGNQYGGLVHWLYIKTLYRVEWIKEFNIWLDGVFGK